MLESPRGHTPIVGLQMRRNDLTTEIRQQIADAYRRGDRPADIAKAHKISDQTVQKIYRTLYPDDEPMSLVERRVNDRLEEISAWRSESLPIHEIARRIGSSTDRTANAMRRFGIEVEWIPAPQPRAPHGRPGRWASGCRCDVCKPAMAEYKRREHEQAMSRMIGPDGIATSGHGKLAVRLGCVCTVCREIRVETGRVRQERTKKKARRHGGPWTGPEVEIVARGDLSLDQMAEMTGRTYAAVSNVRAALADPRHESHHRYMTLLHGEDAGKTGTT